jgi:pre-mRNA-splicing helicase BRR2
VHGNGAAFWLLLEDADGEHILWHDYFVLKRKFGDEEHTVDCVVPVLDPLPPQYFVRVVSDRSVACSSPLLPLTSVQVAWLRD